MPHDQSVDPADDSGPDPNWPAGGAAAFEQLVRATQRDLRVTVAALCYDQPMVDEVLQSTYVVAWRRRGDFRSGSDPLPWLRGIARNLARKERLARSRRWRRHEVLFETPDEHHPGEWLEQRDEARWSRLRLERCLSRLSSEDRELLLLRYRDGRTVAELAKSSGRPAPTLARRLRQLLENLRSCVLGKGKYLRKATERDHA